MPHLVVEEALVVVVGVVVAHVQTTNHWIATVHAQSDSEHCKECVVEHENSVAVVLVACILTTSHWIATLLHAPSRETLTVHGCFDYLTPW